MGSAFFAVSSTSIDIKSIELFFRENLPYCNFECSHPGYSSAYPAADRFEENDMHSLVGNSNVIATYNHHYVMIWDLEESKSILSHFGENSVRSIHHENNVFTIHCTDAFYTINYLDGYIHQTITQPNLITLGSLNNFRIVRSTFNSFTIILLDQDINPLIRLEHPPNTRITLAKMEIIDGLLQVVAIDKSSNKIFVWKQNNQYSWNFTRIKEFETVMLFFSHGSLDYYPSWRKNCHSPI